MAAAGTEFQLPNTPPQGFTFPPSPHIEESDASQTHVEIEPLPTSQTTQHRRNPSHPVLTVDTERARNPAGRPPQVRAIPPPPQAQGALPPPPPIPPPPPQVNAIASRRAGNDLPLRAAVAVATAQQNNRLSITGEPAPVHRSIVPQYNPAAAQAGSRNITPPHRVMPSPPLPAENQSTYPASVYPGARPSHSHNNSLSQAFAATTDPIYAPLPSYRESMMDIPAVIQSNPNDVMDLWCLACGQDVQSMSICYNLGLDCIDLTRNAEFICLTSTGGALYSLKATANDLNVIRTHPFASTNMVSIAMPSLYQPTESSRLVTTIFPVLSKIRAIDHAASVTIANGLSRAEGMALERETIKRAHATTAAPLLCNTQTGTYYLSLPVFSDTESAATSSHHTLCVEIKPNVSIRILEPPSSNETQSPILTFSVPNRVLIVHSHAIVALPSPYAVDILLSAFLALLLHLHRNNDILAPESRPSMSAAVQQGAAPSPPMTVPTFAPPPLVAQNDGRGRSRSAARSASRTRNRSTSQSRGPSRLEAFLHPSRARSAMSSYSTQDQQQQQQQQQQPIQQSSSLQTTPPRSANRLSTYSMQSATATLRNSPPLPSSNTLAVRPSNEMMMTSFAGTPPPMSIMPTSPNTLEKGLHGGAVTVVETRSGAGREGGGVGLGGGAGGAGGDREVGAQGTAPEPNDPLNTGLDLSRFQAYDLADPRLGPGARLALRLLYAVFAANVWLLGSLTGIFAEAVVAVASCGVGLPDKE